LRNTLLRTGIIALAIGAVFASFRGGLARWPSGTLLALWPAFGGHWIEVWFLNRLRPRLPAGRGVQVSVRIATWFTGGVVLGACMHLTATALPGFRMRHWPAWWIGGLAFIAIELAAHLPLQFMGRPGFYNGRG
jgi:hypothetical protein